MKILGIELGAWSLKAVEMESRFRRLEILDFHEIKLPLEFSDAVSTYKDAVTKLMGRLPSHHEKTVTSLPASQTALRFLHLPIKQLKQVEKTFRFELEDSLPFDLEDANVEHQISKTKEGSQVLAGIAIKKHIKTHIEWLETIGVNPDWLTFEGMGLINYYLTGLNAQKKKKKGQEEEDSAQTLLLDIGHLKTNFAFLDEDRLDFFRSLPWGSHLVTQAIAATLNLPLQQAEEKKIKDLTLSIGDAVTGNHAIELQKAAIQGFQPLITDIQHTLVTFRAQKKKEINRVLLAGGTAQTKGIEKFLTKALGVPTERLQPMEGVRFGKEMEPGQVLSFAEGIGRAIVFTRKAPLLFNFRKHELAKETSLTAVGSLVKDPNVVSLLKYAGVLALILFVYVNVASPIADSAASKANKQVVKAFRETFRNTKPKQARILTKNPDQLRKFISKKLKEADQKLRMMKKKRTPMLELVQNISSSFTKATRVDVNRLRLDDRSLVIEGVLYQGTLDEVTAALNKVNSLNGVKLTMDGKRFTYRGSVEGR